MSLDDESTLFKHAMKGVKPLDQKARVLQTSATKPIPSAPTITTMSLDKDIAPLSVSAAGTLSLSELQKNQFIGLDKHTVNRLKKGTYPIDGMLDLHGCRQEEALAQLTAFIGYHYLQGSRCVRVVTGIGDTERGTGVLRKQLLHWLNLPSLRPHVLAVTSAIAKDGGEGAVYVLLRTGRKGI